MKKVLCSLMSVAVLALIFQSCSTDPASSDTTPPPIPLIASPMSIDSGAVADLQAGEAVTIAVEGKEVVLTLVEHLADTQSATLENVLALQTGQDTITYFRKISSGIAKVRADSSLDADSLTGTWRAFQMSVNDDIFDIADDSENCLEVTIAEAATGTGITIEMHVTGTPDISKAEIQKHPPVFEDDSLTISAKMSGLKVGVRQAIPMRVTDEDLGDTLLMGLFVTNGRMSDAIVTGDSLIWTPLSIDTGAWTFIATASDEEGGRDTLHFSAYVLPPLFVAGYEWNRYSSFVCGTEYAIYLEPQAPAGITLTLLDSVENLSILGDTLYYNPGIEDTGTIVFSIAAENAAGRKDTLQFTKEVILSTIVVFLTTSGDMPDTLFTGVEYRDTIRFWSPNQDSVTRALTVFFTGISDITGFEMEQDSILVLRPSLKDTALSKIRVMGYGGAVVEWSVVVVPANMPPVFRVSEDDSLVDTAVVAETYQRHVQVVDYLPFCDTLTVTILQGPAAMTIEASSLSTGSDGWYWSGYPTWVPTVSDTGETSVTVMVEDQQGLSDTLTWSIVVTE